MPLTLRAAQEASRLRGAALLVPTSSRPTGRYLRAVAAALAVTLSALGCRRQTAPAVATPSAPPVAGIAAPVDVAALRDLGPIPVTPADPARGHADAPVTVVWFADLQCPFSARAAGTLAELESRYSGDQLRIVWKHLPLPFHGEARRAAEHAAAVFMLGGAKAFWAFTDTVSKNISSLDGAPFAEWAVQAGVAKEALAAELASGRPAAKVDADKALAERLGADGTPTFYINGVLVVGAQPLETFVAAIEAQRERAREALSRGTARPDLYAELARTGFAQPVPRLQVTEERDTTVWRVPVGKSPVRGKPTALVTIVEFSDFQCPFCRRVQPQLDALRSRYGDDVRFVFKQAPLPFHDRAEPAAELSLEARAQRGDAGFYEVHDALFAASGLETADLEAVARAAHLDVAAVRKALATKRHTAVIAEDLDLAEAVQVQGTPHFFINGRRLVGAQPLAAFTAVIDEELVKAKALLARGVSASSVYDELQKTAAFEPKPGASVALPAPTAEQPFLGARNAKVVVQEFADFECTYCAQADPTIQALLAAYPGKIKVVWRHRPLPMHANAPLASEAAIEAFKQKGNAAFWAYRSLLFAGQGESGGLEREALVRYAKKVGLDDKRFGAALDDHRHARVIEADVAIADSAGITGTPTFVVNGTSIVGAQPLAVFRRAVDRALKK